MRPFFRRALLGAGATVLAVALTSPPASAGVGTRLRNGAGATSGLCMSITNAGRGTSVEMEPCNLNAHQGWELEFVPGQDVYFQIVSQDADARGRCLTAHGEGVRVTMDRCSDLTDPYNYDRRQSWHRLPMSTYGWDQYGLYLDGASRERQCLDVRGNGTDKVVQIWLCGPLDPPGIKGNQMWKFW